MCIMKVITLEELLTPVKNQVYQVSWISVNRIKDLLKKNRDNSVCQPLHLHLMFKIIRSTRFHLNLNLFIIMSRLILIQSHMRIQYYLRVHSPCHHQLHSALLSPFLVHHQLHSVLLSPFLVQAVTQVWTQIWPRLRLRL